jgi:hypothetical protein
MNLVDRAKNIIMTPTTEWEVIKGETLSTGEMIGGYAAILALIPAAAGFIGKSLIGISLLGSTIKIPIVPGFLWAVLTYIMSLVSLWIMATIIDALAPSFGATKDMSGSMKVSVFSMTAAWVAGIFTLIPLLGILSILGLYSLYLLYGGMKTIKAPAPDKMMAYYLITIVVAIVVYFVISMVVSAVVLGPYLATEVLRGM